MSEPARNASPGTGRVLVVDDSLSVRRAIERMLAPRGLTVIPATGGGEAIERLGEERPDLVICDVMLPEVDGFEVCRFVRGDAALADVPVLLISGAGSPEVEQRAAEVGAAGVLTKPFTGQSLVARVEELVSGGRAPALGVPGGARTEAVLAQLATMRGFKTAFAIDAEMGEGCRAGGGPVPASLVTLVREAVALAGELGLGGSHDLLIDGEGGTLVVQRLGQVCIAVCFDDSTLMGLARHQVRRVCSSHDPRASRGSLHGRST